MYVSKKVYKEYKKCKNREEYLYRKDRRNNVYGFEDYNKKTDLLVDGNFDVEKIIETKMLIDNLYCALESLNDEERNLIEALYFDDKTLIEVAKQKGTNPMKISRIRNKVLRKLKDILER